MRSDELRGATAEGANPSASVERGAQPARGRIYASWPGRTPAPDRLVALAASALLCCALGACRGDPMTTVSAMTGGWGRFGSRSITAQLHSKSALRCDLFAAFRP